jgi:hypothetical protein
MDNVNNWMLWRHENVDGDTTFVVRTSNLDPSGQWPFKGDPAELDCLACGGKGTVLDPAVDQQHAATVKTTHESDCRKLRRYSKKSQEELNRLFGNVTWQMDWASDQ